MVIQAAVMLSHRAWGTAEPRLVVAHVVINVVILVADVARVHVSSYVWTQNAFLALYLALSQIVAGGTPPGAEYGELGARERVVDA